MLFWEVTKFPPTTQNQILQKKTRKTRILTFSAFISIAPGAPGGLVGGRILSFASARHEETRGVFVAAASALKSCGERRDNRGSKTKSHNLLVGGRNL